MSAAPTFSSRCATFDVPGIGIITGLRFDPSSTAENLVLWVSHGAMALEKAPHWTGKNARS